MRKWSPTESDNGEKGKTVYQIVVPTVHRREVLELAHDLPMSGYLAGACPAFLKGGVQYLLVP